MARDRSVWTLGRVIAEQAERHGDRVFLRIVDGPSQTYAEMHRLALRLAGGFSEHGVEKGDTVVVMLPNGLEVIACWLALGTLGAIEVCINTGYRGAPLEHAINTCRAKVIVAAAEFLPLLQGDKQRFPHLEKVIVVGEIPAGEYRFALESYELLAQSQPWDGGQGRVTGQDIASIIYTSGTTGPAKAVLMPHAQIHLLASMTLHGMRLTPDDISYCFHPMFHMAGKFMAVYGTLMAGATMILDRGFDPATWISRVREYGATAGYAHGPMLEMIYAQPELPSDRDHRMTRLLTAPFPKRIAEGFERRFGIRGLEVWGMTEVGIPTWFPFDEPLRTGSCGKVADEWFELRIVDPETDEQLPTGEVGEIVVRGKEPWIMMQGYMGMPEATVEAWRNLWFHSGDVGYIDEDGYVYFVDRLKDKIRRRAEMISSYEIESAALAHPDVAEAAAVGVPSEFEGDDDVKISLVLRQGAQLDPEDFIHLLAGSLPHYMIPRYVEILEALPRTPTNKVKKSELRDEGAGAGVWDRKVSGRPLREIIEEHNNATSQS